MPRAGVFLRTTAGVYTGLYAATNTSGFFCIGDVPAGTYDVEVRVDDYRVGYERNVVVVDAPVDVELEAAIPVARLDIAPIPARTHVAFDLFTNRNVPVRLEVFDAAGRSLRAWGANAVTGQRTFTWDFRDRHGRIVPAGQYFVRLEAGSRVVVRRLTRIQ